MVKLRRKVKGSCGEAGGVNDVGKAQSIPASVKRLFGIMRGRFDRCKKQPFDKAAEPKQRSFAMPHHMPCPTLAPEILDIADDDVSIFDLNKTIGPFDQSVKEQMLLRELDAARSTILAHEAKAEQSEKVEQDLRCELQGRTEQLAEMKRSKDALHVAFQNTQTAYDAAIDIVDTSNMKIEDLTQKCDDYHKKVVALEQRAEILQSKIDRQTELGIELEGKVATMVAQNESLKERLVRAINESAAKEATISSNEYAIATQSRKYLDLREHASDVVEDLEKSLEAAGKVELEDKLLIFELGVRNDHLARANSALLPSVESNIQTRMIEQDDKNAELAASFKSSERVARSSTSTIQKLETEISDLKQKVIQQDTDLMALEVEVNVLNIQRQATIGGIGRTEVAVEIGNHVVPIHRAASRQRQVSAQADIASHQADAAEIETERGGHQTSISVTHASRNAGFNAHNSEESRYDLGAGEHDVVMNADFDEICF